jgi:hypothetical protein
MWKYQHRDKYRDWSWVERGIDMTVVKYDLLYAKQAGACAICKKEAARFKLVVDHCHVSGKTRGLLCRRCNLIAQEPAFLRKVLSYMEGGEKTAQE